MDWKKLSAWMLAATLAMALGCGGGEEAEPAEEGAAEESAAYFQVDPSTAATVTGKANLEGDPPKMRPINMSAEPDCKQLHDAAVMPEVVVKNDNGTLKNVFVWVKSGLEGKKFEVPNAAVQLDQKGCIYRPHVVGLQRQQVLRVSNSDPTTHNVHPLPTVNQEWNKSQSASAPDLEWKFPREELKMAVKCNIHPWMRSYIYVIDHPFFAITGDDGSFEMKGLPPGTYTVEAIHEQLGSKEMSVTLGDAESKDIEFAFSAS